MKKNIFKKITYAFVQSEAHKKRFHSLGIHLNRISNVGSVKFDIEINDSPSRGLHKKKIILAASTHINEDEIVKMGGKELLELFESSVEENLIEPTFVIGYPVEVSPLSRRNNENPEIADRFELFIGGKEIANGFCELNDPDDQADRFREQVKAKDTGDKEAMSFDEDYVTALEHGMPPAVGVGIGIDRLVMMITNQTSIRDVILFPQLKS